MKYLFLDVCRRLCPFGVSLAVIVGSVCISSCTPSLNTVPLSLNASGLDALFSSPSLSSPAFRTFGSTAVWQFQQSVQQNVVSSPQQVEFVGGVVRLVPHVTEDTVGVSFTGQGQKSGSLSPVWTPHYDQLLGYWPMHLTSSGGTVLSGFSATGVSVPGDIYQPGSGQPGMGSSQLVPGFVNSAFQFDGATGIYVPLLTNTLQGPQQPDLGFAISFWFKTSQATQPLFAVVSGKNAPDGYGDRMITLNNGILCSRLLGAGGTWGYWGYEPYEEQYCVDHTYGIPNYADQNWHHVVLTYQKNVPGPHLYVDGNPVWLQNIFNTNFTQTFSYALPPFQPAGFQLGYVPNGNRVAHPFSNSYFVGALSEVALFSNFFSYADVKVLYSRQKNQRYQGFSISPVLDSGFLNSIWNSLKWVTSNPFGKSIVAQLETGYGNPVTDFASALVAHWTFQESYTPQSASLANSVGSWTPTPPFAALSFLDHSNQGHSLSASVGGGYPYVFYDPVTNQQNFTNVYFSPKVRTEVQAPFLKPVLHLLSGHDTGLSTPDHPDFQWVGDWSVAGWFYLPKIMRLDSSVNLASYPLLSKMNGSVPSPLYWEVTPTLHLKAVLGNGVQAEVALDANRVVPTDQWVHLALTYDHQIHQLTHFINGQGAPPLSVSLTPGPSGLGPLFVLSTGTQQDPFGNFVEFTGMIHDLALWKDRVLSGTELAELYQRGAHTLSLHVRSCGQADCSDGVFQGPDGTARSYFSETSSHSPQATPVVALPPSGSGSLPGGRYVQYQTFFDAASNASLPALTAVQLGPSHYDDSHPWVFIQTSHAFSQVSQFSETPGTDSTPGCSTYQLSPDNGNTWYYWEAIQGQWRMASLNSVQSNTPAQINTGLSQWNAQLGSGTLGLKLFLSSDGTHPCSVEQVTLQGSFH